MMAATPRERVIERITHFLASPRFVTALTTVIVGTAVATFLLRQLIGWAGLIAILTTLVLFAGASLFARREEIQWRGLLPISLLVFIGWAGVSIFWSQYRWATLGGLAYLGCLTALALYVALLRDTIQIIRAFGDVLRVILAVSIAIEILAGVLIDAPIGFLSVLGKLDELGPIQGVMGARNQLGIIALIALITFGTEFRTHMTTRGLAIGSLVLAAVCLLLTRSPLALGATLIVAIAAAALYGLRRAEPERRRLLQIGLLIFTAVVGSLAWAFRAVVVGLFNAGGDLNYRLEVWRRVFDLVPIRPLQGWGWIGTWREDIAPFQLFTDVAARETTSASNGFLDVWFQLGLVGLAIFVGLVGLAFVRSWLLASRKRSIVYAWPALVLVAIIITGLGESSILVEFGWLTFVLCSVKASHHLSWRQAFAAHDLEPGRNHPST